MSGACVNSLYPLGDVIVGNRPGDTPLPFKNLAQYDDYIASVAKSGKVCPVVSIPFSEKPEKRYPTPFTGFMEFQPGNLLEQASYSPMSPAWMGVEPTAKAFNKRFFQ